MKYLFLESGDCREGNVIYDCIEYLLVSGNFVGIFCWNYIVFLVFIKENKVKIDVERKLSK